MSQKIQVGFYQINFQYDDDYFKKVLWSDETEIIFFDHNDPTHVQREVVAARSKKNTISTMKHGVGNTMAWEYFGYSGTEEC